MRIILQSDLISSTMDFFEKIRPNPLIGSNLEISGSNGFVVKSQPIWKKLEKKPMMATRKNNGNKSRPNFLTRKYAYSIVLEGVRITSPIDSKMRTIIVEKSRKKTGI